MSEAPVRRLAAIMFTDVVGYTELTERDERRAVRARDRHRAILRPLVKQFEGELLETPGDESLSTFPSALLAVDCALAVQAALRDDADLRLRIGIHLGDVMRRDGELFGEGVNLAARIRPLADPGGVCVSDAVWQQVRNRGHIKGRSLGAQRFKNVAEPIVVYALEPDRGREARSWWRRWPARVAVALVALLGLGFASRSAIITSAALWGPKLFATPIAQNLGFATTSDGVRIAYATTGAGPPVVYVLGWATHLEDGIGSPIYDVDELLPMSSRRNLFVRYDGRGFGLSDRNVTDFSLDARVRDIEAVVDALGLERVALYATSAGGPAAIAFTARHPERVTRLVLASSLASYRYLDAPARARWERVLGLAETDWDNPSVKRMFTEVLFGASDDEVQMRVIAEFFGRSGTGPAIAAFERAGLADDETAAARRIRVPTLVLHARDDKTVYLEAGRELASLIPGARFEIVEGAHWEGAGNSVATRARIFEFLNEGEPAIVER